MYEYLAVSSDFAVIGVVKALLIDPRFLDPAPVYQEGCTFETLAKELLGYHI